MLLLSQTNNKSRVLISSMVAFPFPVLFFPKSMTKQLSEPVCGFYHDVEVRLCVRVCLHVCDSELCVTLMFDPLAVPECL